MITAAQIAHELDVENVEINYGASMQEDLSNMENLRDNFLKNDDQDKYFPKNINFIESKESKKLCEIISKTSI